MRQRGANDRLHDAVDRNPDRFAAFAALPTPDPQAAAAELDRTVTRLGTRSTPRRKPGTDWLAAVPLSPEDKGKLANGNARRLLKL